jgi:putative DNA primase/helicase
LAGFSLLKERRKHLKAKGTTPIPEKVKPWATELVPAAVLDEAHQSLQGCVSLKPSQSRAVVLMAVLTHLTDVVNILPILLITSPEEECGKTTLLKWFLRVANQPIPASNVSAAAIYRVIKESCPTLILDEADTFLKENEELRNVINSGHERDFAFVMRVNPDTGQVERFTTWCAKVIAMIGKPKRTILSRAIHIKVQRKADFEVQEFDEAFNQKLTEIHAKIARIAQQIREEVRTFKTSLLSNRARDNWRPLLAIAHAAGSEWERLTLSAAIKIEEQLRQSKDDFRRYLIEALGELVKQKRKERGIAPGERFFLKTDDILSTGDGLNADKEAPWREKDCDSLNAHRLGAELGEYDVKSHLVRTEKGRPARGYWSDEIEKISEQYHQKSI